jgi:hypothetical protein
MLLLLLGMVSVDIVVVVVAWYDDKNDLAHHNVEGKNDFMMEDDDE